MKTSLAVYYYKLLPWQRNPEAWWRYSNCFLDGDGVSMTVSLAAGYPKFSADQGNVVGLARYANCLALDEGTPMNKSLVCFDVK
jgi:TPR repeat protein